MDCNTTTSSTLIDKKVEFDTSAVLTRRKCVKVEQLPPSNNMTTKRQPLMTKSSTTTTTTSISTSIIDTTPNLTCTDASSVDSTLSHTGATKWTGAYEPSPVVSQSTILLVGTLLFVLAAVWPPLILLVAYIASKMIPYSFRDNDDATARRQLFQEFYNATTATAVEEDDDDDDENDKQDNLPVDLLRNVPSHIHKEESYWINQRGMALCTYILTPKHVPVKAVVCYCHGYTDYVSYSKLVENYRLVDQGIAFVAIEYEGHGRSDGPLGLVNDWDKLVGDVCAFFSEITSKRFPDIPVFLMGESMGGAVAYCTHQRCPDIFKGVVFVCPMCKISDDMLPAQWVIDFLFWLIGPTGTNTTLLGYLPIAPSKGSLREYSYKLKDKYDEAARCPLNFGRNPRMATARELILVTQRISSSLYSFDAPFLVLHGKADRVTDPKLSKALYEESCSKDKSIRLYDGMWHSLLSGEPDENIDLVFNDIIQWISERL